MFVETALPTIVEQPNTVGVPETEAQKMIRKMIDLVHDDRWMRDYQEGRGKDGRFRHCALGLIRRASVS